MHVPAIGSKNSASSMDMSSTRDLSCPVENSEARGRGPWQTRTAMYRMPAGSSDLMGAAAGAGLTALDVERELFS